MENYHLDTKPSPVDERDWIAETIYPPVSELQLPKKLDLRSDLPKIRDQGSQGTCAAQTAACMKEWQERQDIGFVGYMAPQFIYNNRENYPNSGMYGRDVMKILRTIGSCPEYSYPYGKIEKADEIKQNIITEAGLYKTKSYAKVYTIEGLKKALWKNGPCYISFPTFNNERTFWKPRQGDKQKGGHAVAAVGYDKNGFIIRNSWGDKWGDHGYTYYPNTDFGSHWEIWTAIDDSSSVPDPKPPPKLKSCF